MNLCALLNSNVNVTCGGWGGGKSYCHGEYQLVVLILQGRGSMPKMIDLSK